MKLFALTFLNIFSSFTFAQSVKFLEPSPIAGRTGHSATSIETKAIFWGGFNDGFPFGPSVLLNDGASYDIKTKSWNKIASANAPSPRTKHYATAIAGKMYIVGGCDNWQGPRCENFTTTGGVYDPKSDSWSKIADAPKIFRDDPKFNPPGVLENRYLVFFDDVTSIYDTQTDQWSQVNVPSFLGENYFLSDLNKIYVGDKVIAFLDKNDGSPIRIGFFSFQDSKWTEMPSYSDFNTCSSRRMIYSSNKILIFGGRCSEAKGSKDTSIFDLKTNVWSSGAQIPFEIGGGSALSMVAGNGMVFLYDPVYEDYKHNHEIFTFDINLNSWKNIGINPASRGKKIMTFSSALAAVDNNLVIWGGMEENFLPTYFDEGALANF